MKPYMRRDLFVYISGPMTAKDGVSIEENVAAGARVYWELLQRGIPAFCPHLSGAFPTAWAILPHEAWLDYDFAVIERCTHVLMLPRWDTSVGARLERDYAHVLGKPVVFSIEALELPQSLAAVDPVGEVAKRDPSTRE
jgi:hypothetical protein